MTNHSSGHEAESKAAQYLQELGYEILDTNWHTRWCEIDIVARRDRRVYFVEVKSRKTSGQGSGLDYITPQKLRQMSFAADMWVSNHDWAGEYQLSALAIDGDHITFIESVT